MTWPFSSANDREVELAYLSKILEEQFKTNRRLLEIQAEMARTLRPKTEKRVEFPDGSYRPHYPPPAPTPAPPKERTPPKKSFLPSWFT